MIKYDKTKWVDGTTVLRASHMEKIEKGITDIIDYNNSIYTDEAKRKENEIKREEEHNKRLEEINSSIKDIQTDYDSLQKVIIDENASANLQNQINQTNSQLEHNKNELDNKISNLDNLKATKNEVDVERKRIDKFTRLEEGSTTGDAELIDARIGADGVTYDTIGSAIRTQVSNIYTDLDSVTVKCDVPVNIPTENLTILEGYGLTKISDTKYTIEPRSINSVVCIPVQNYTKLKLKVSAFYSYNCLGIVYATTTDIPNAWNGNNSKECLSMTTYDPYLGYRGEVWKQFETDIEIPNECKMVVFCIENTSEDYAKYYTKKAIFKYEDEFADAKRGTDETVYNTLGEAIRGQVNNIQKNLYGEVEVTTPLNPDSATLLEGYAITKISDTKYTIEPKSTKNVLCFPVNEGERYNLSLETYKGVYNCLGIVYATTTDIPNAWNGNNSKECLSMTTYDPYFNSSVSTAWTTVTGETIIPSGCNMLVICISPTSSPEEAVRLWTKEFRPKFISTDTITKYFDNEVVRKTIFNIEEAPSITTGKLYINKYKVKNNNKAYFWKFNTSGSMEAKLNFYCKNNDTVGVWLWFNFTQLDYRNNLDGALNLKITGCDTIQKYTAYNFKNGWNYVELGKFKEGFQEVSLTITYSLVRGDYVLGIDSIELNYKPYKKPKILLSFDMMSSSLYTVRYPLLKSYGFPATVCNVAGLTEEQRANIFADGWDWAIYGNGSVDTLGLPRPSLTSGTVDEWTTYFQTVLDKYAEIGLYNPISYFSPENTGNQTLMEAEKKVGFRMSRIACSGNELTGYFDKDSFFIYTLGVGGTDTSEGINKQIDDAISQNKSLCIFTHDIEEVVTDNMNCSRDVYTGILEHLKDLVESDKCEVVTFRQFYQYCEPNDYAELMAIRHEKEKAYILNKLQNK